MIAGTLALLDSAADDDLDSRSSGFTTLDVREAQEYLDGATVQHGRACARVESRTEDIYVNGTTIEAETVGSTTKVWTEWVADVTDAGFLVTERTAGSEPTFPFDMFEVTTGVGVARARIDTDAFVEAQRRADNNPKAWFSASKTETADDDRPNDVDMGYGRDANAAGGNVGVGFSTAWNGRRIKGIMYASGYLAIYSDWVGTTAFAQFVREEILPHASVPDDGEVEQETIAEAETCDDCGRESDTIEDGLCIVCQDRREEEEEQDAYDRLETVNMTDGGADNAE